MSAMQPPDTDTRKRREIWFREPHPDSSQARSALLLLSGVEGVLELDAPSSTCLKIVYNVCQITLQDIESALDEVGFHLDNSLLSKLRRTLWYYAEDTQRANMGCELDNSNSTRRVFVNRYQKLEHGCRDERPQHWRKYL